MSTPAASGSRPAAVPSIQEFSIRVPKNSRKRHNVMRFNGNLNVDIQKWTQVKMERENNAREYKGFDEEMPKFGAGSEFGRDAREEARRKKFGITARKYKPENQPWILKTDGKTGKKFKGIREGGIGDNAAYYVFTHAPDGAIEAFPLHEWYNFQPIQRYKTLTFEEVEDELKRRVKRMSRWSLMEKRLKKEEDNNDEDPDLEGGKAKKLEKIKPDLQISEMDDWANTDDSEPESDEDGGSKKKKKTSDDDNDDDEDADKKKKKKKTIMKKKKKKRDSDDEAFEESDDGDEEGRECEYLTDSTESEDEVESKEIKSVAEEDGLRKTLESDEDDEEENNEDKKDDDEFEEDEAKDNKDKAKEMEKKKDKKKKKLKKKDVKKNSKDSSPSEGSSDSGSDSDAPKDSKDISKKLNSAHNSRSSTPTVVAGGSTDSQKRKATSSPDLSQAKKIKTETPAPVYVPTTPISGSNEGITEDAVRRYLMRKPMTTTELLQKFKSKKTGLSSEKLVVMMTQILKKINPTRQTFKNKMYLSLKEREKTH